MGDDRLWASESSLRASDYLETTNAVDDEAIDDVVPVAHEAEVGRPTGLPGTGDSAEFLRIRWETPRGRKVRAQVLRDLRVGKSAHLAEILHDLRGAEGVPGFFDLRCIRLDGENLSHTRLARADLSGASLAKANLLSADLAETRLVKARLVGATLREADLSRADLTDANLTEANLEGATAVSAVFGRARCIGAEFRGAALVGADFRGAMLVRAIFEGADLGGASVEGAHVLAGAFARAAQQPGGLTAVNELVLGGEAPAAGSLRAPEAARLERTRTGSFVLHKVEATAPASDSARDRRPSARLPVPGLAAATPPAPAPPAPTGASRNWDAALSALLLQRGRVGRITVVLDGVERVVFER